MSVLARHLLGPQVEHEAIRRLQDALAEERERREAIERRLEEQEAELATLRRQLAERARERRLRRATGDHPPRRRRVVELPGRGLTPGSDHWLHRCEGFEVEIGTKRVGTVAGVRFGSRLDCPDVLVVSAGPWPRRSVLVPVDRVAEIVPSARRIALTTDAPLDAT